MAEDFGYYQGLASVKSNVGDMIGDYERHDLRMQQNKALAESKAKLFADSVAYQNSANAFDAPLIKEYNTKITKELGAYVKENPDWTYNPDKRAFLDEKRRKIFDNEHVLRAKASDDAKKKLDIYLTEVSKKPEGYNKQAYKDLLDQWDNYSKYGNQLGIKARQEEGMKPFTFTKPEDFVDLPEVYRTMGSSIKANGFENINNGRDGAFRTYAKPEDLKAVSTEIYLKHKAQLDQELTSKGVDPIIEGMKRLVPHVKTDYNNGEKNRLGEQMALAKYTHSLKMAGEQISSGRGNSFFDKTIRDTDWVRPPAEKLAETFGSTPKHFLPNGSGGAPIDNTGDVFYYEGDIYDKGYRTDGKYKKTGVKVADGFVIKPISFGVDVAQYLYDPNGASGDPNLKGTDYDDYEIKPEFKKIVSFIDTKPDKEGKTQKVLKIKTNAEFDSNDPYYRGKWDDNLLTTKQKEGYGVTQTQEVYQDDVGNLFDGNGKYLGKAK